MKNLPTYIIEKVKAYDEKSDLARVSGIDDGEEQTVLDFTVKRGMNKGVFSNVDLAAGTRDRYSARGMGALFQDDTKIMAFGNANNTNDMGFPGGGGGGRFGGARNGLNSSKMLGGNFNYELEDKLKLNGSLRWNHNGRKLHPSVKYQFQLKQLQNLVLHNKQEYQIPDSKTQLHF